MIGAEREQGMITVLRRGRVRANGVRFAFLEAGEGDELALLFHGFPDEAGSMKGLVEALAGAGFRAVAPFMRGYDPTGLAPERAYDPLTLGGDALALIEALGADRAVLVGHDWGAVAAYIAAALDPERLVALVAMAVPPPSTLLRGLPRHPGQLRRSWYMGAFQLPLAPVMIRATDMALLWRLWRQWSPGWEPPARRLEAVERALRPPGSLEAAIDYYHQLRPGRLGIAEWLRGLALLSRPLEVPALLLAGERDGCIGIELFDGAEEAFTSSCRLERVAGAGHFLHLERPEIVEPAVLEFLDQRGRQRRP